jgi:hypothetical protein
MVRYDFAGQRAALVVNSALTYAERFLQRDRGLRSSDADGSLPIALSEGFPAFLHACLRGVKCYATKPMVR